MTDSDQQPVPFVSVILPARNEEQFLAQTIRSLRAQSYPASHIEIVVADNGSTDRTCQVATDHGARVVNAANMFVGAVRNIGAAAAAGDVLAFIDGDCTAGSKCIMAAVSALEDSRVGAVGGVCSAPSDGTWMERAWPSPGPTESKTTNALAASCLILRRELFEQIGGFDESLTSGEDDEISARIRARGYTLLVLPECEVVHYGYPKNAAAIVRRQFWHGRSQLQVATSIFEPLLVATHIFALLILVIIGAVILGRIDMAVLALTGTGLLSLAAALRRGARDKVHLIQLSIMWWFTFVGRSGGLLFSYLRVLRDLVTSIRAPQG